MPLAGLATADFKRSVLCHFLASLESARVELEPFPHFFMESCFPDEVYQELVGRLPATEFYEQGDYSKHFSESGVVTRGRFRLGNSSLEQLSSEQQRLLDAVRSVLASDAVKRSVFRKLQSGLAHRFRCPPDSAENLPGFALPELYRETSGYRIAPHPDTRKKIVTMQISLARDESQAGLGTEFYQRSMRPSAWLRDPKGFEIVKTMPFLPNAAYAFSVLNTVRIKSWHGRSQLPESAGTRDSILNIWYAKAEQGNQDLLRDRQWELEVTRAA